MRSNFFRNCFVTQNIKIFNILAKLKRASIIKSLRAYYFVFRVINTIFHYDLVVINSNDKIIRDMFQAKNQMFLFNFNYLQVL